MDISSLGKVTTGKVLTPFETQKIGATGTKTDGSAFDGLLSAAMENLQTTNAYLSDAENEELKWAMGESESTHDLTNAMQKANVALQYTVAVRDKVLEAYREIMQIQI
jgi:flagellar hook-basal body complex protein FliE